MSQRLLMRLAHWLRGQSDLHVIDDTTAGTTVVYTMRGPGGRRMRVLEADGGWQSATYLEDGWNEPIFEYHRRFDVMFEAGLPIARVCLIGGGGYSYPKHLLSTHPEVSADVIEIDPRVTEAARQWFFLDRLEEACGPAGDGRLSLVTADGRSWLEKTETVYDALVCDTFTGTEPATDLMGPDAARLFHDRLVPGGIYLANVVSALVGPDSACLSQVTDALLESFASVQVVSCDHAAPDEPTNNVVVATDTPFEVPGSVFSAQR